MQYYVGEKSEMMLTFWVVERFEDGNARSLGYWTGHNSRDFTPNIIDAMQFIRKEDALLAKSPWHWKDCEATEHKWLEPSSEWRQHQAWCKCTDCLKNKSAQGESHSYLPPLGDSRFHFEDKQVMDALVGTEYLRTEVQRRIQFMTTGEKWSLYRAVAKLIDIEKAGVQS
jgi:hypothetical protein